MEWNGQEHEDTWCQRDPPDDDNDNNYKYNDDDDTDDGDEVDDDDHLQSLQTGLNLLSHADCTKVFPIPRIYLHSPLIDWLSYWLVRLVDWLTDFLSE